MRNLATALILSAAAAPALAQQPAAPSARALHLRYLTWPGKVAPHTQPAPSAPVPAAPVAVASRAPQPSATPPRGAYGWPNRYRPVPHGPSHFLGQVTPAQEAAIERQRAADKAQAEKALAMAEAAKAKAEAEQKQAEIRASPLPPPARALPNSIYAPPPAQAAQAARPAVASNMAVADGGFDQHARFYSLHRAYGQRPDPVTLSPQFLSTPSADLADPPPPPPPRILPGQAATPAQQTAARVAARQASGSD
jgi:hypothetical protein